MKTINLLQDELMHSVIGGHHREEKTPSDVANKALYIYALLTSGGLDSTQIDTLADQTKGGRKGKQTELGEQLDKLANSL